MAPKANAAARGAKRKRNEQQPEVQVYTAKHKVLVLGDGGELLKLEPLIQTNAH